jgi:hypothetical protein
VPTGSTRGWPPRNWRPAAARSGEEKRGSGGGSEKGCETDLGEGSAGVGGGCGCCVGSRLGVSPGEGGGGAEALRRGCASGELGEEALVRALAVLDWADHGPVKEDNAELDFRPDNYSRLIILACFRDYYSSKLSFHSKKKVRSCPSVRLTSFSTIYIHHSNPDLSLSARVLFRPVQIVSLFFKEKQDICSKYTHLPV